MELLRKIIGADLTYKQIFICCAVVMFLCFGFVIFTSFKLLSKVISQANAETDTKNVSKKITKLNQKETEKKNNKKKLLLLFSIFGILGVIDWYSDKIPFMIDTASKTGMSFSFFIILVACLGICIVIGYIPYKLLKLILTNATIESGENKKENSKGK